QGQRAILRLGPLSRAEVTELVSRLLPPSFEDAGGIDERVWSLSHGNAFVAVEATRAIREDRSVMAGGAVPPQVRDMIAARFTRLGEDSRRLLAVAAVVGRDCSLQLLQAAGGTDGEQTATAIEELVRRRILRSDGESFGF